LLQFLYPIAQNSGVLWALGAITDRRLLWRPPREWAVPILPHHGSFDRTPLFHLLQFLYPIAQDSGVLWALGAITDRRLLWRPPREWAVPILPHHCSFDRTPLFHLL